MAQEKQLCNGRCRNVFCFILVLPVGALRRSQLGCSRDICEKELRALGEMGGGVGTRNGAPNLNGKECLKIQLFSSLARS